MSYRVLARAYRSGTFDEVVGQEAVSTTLKNAIAAERVHHGYLFTGTRGVGKTSMARILAKALNCQSADAPTTTPCCTCDSCVSISEGEDVDVIEIDAASNTGVDNIRELRGNTSLRPARSRFKVYIIDEVHMLSTGAFNALLKTLEEPPGHVKFILATTESHKVPATIQSRCQRFDFRAIDAPAITAHLAEIVAKEEIEVDEEVLRRVARLANGSMRDALSLLDKLLSYESEHLTAEVAAMVIPPPHDELAAAVIEAVASRDAAKALSSLDDALQGGRTVGRFCDNLIEHVRTLMVLAICGADSELVDVSSAMRGPLADQAKAFDGATYVYMISLLEELRRSVKSSGAGRALADAAIVRLAMSENFSDLKTLLGQLRSAEAAGDDVKKNAPPRGNGVSGQAARVSQRTAATPARPPAHPNAAPAQTAPDRAAARRAEPLREAPRLDVAPAAKAQPPRPSPQDRPASQDRPGVSAGSSAWNDAINDPVVQKVRDLFDATLLDVRPIRPDNALGGGAGAADEESGDDANVETGGDD